MRGGEMLKARNESAESVAGALYALGYRTTPRLDPPLAFLGQKRPHDLMNETRRHEFPNADIGRRAETAFAEIGAKHQIPDHHILAVIPVRLAQILAVVPAVQLRRVENPEQRTEVHLDVAVRDRKSTRLNSSHL